MGEKTELNEADVFNSTQEKFQNTAFEDAFSKASTDKQQGSDPRQRKDRANARNRFKRG